MGNMNKVAVAVAAAFVASVKCEQMLASLGKSVAHSQKFRLMAGRIVAKDANAFYKLHGEKQIVAYETEYGGAKGVAFGVAKWGKNDDGEHIILSYERTKQADAVRAWFGRNVSGKRAKSKSAPKGGVWARIADDIHAINSLKAKLDTQGRKALEKALSALVEKFSAKVEA